MTSPKARKRRSRELRPEYDFAALPGGVRGKYLRRASAGTNLVLLDPDVASAFRDDRTVNETLRLLVNLARGSARTNRTVKAKSG